MKRLSRLIAFLASGLLPLAVAATGWQGRVDRLAILPVMIREDL